MIPDHDVDVLVNLQTAGERGIESAKNAVNKLSAALGGVGGTAEAAEEGVEDFNKEILETVAGVNSATGSLAGFESQLLSTKAITELLDDDLNALADDTEVVGQIFGQALGEMDDLEDLDLHELGDALEGATDEAFESGDLDSSKFVRQFFPDKQEAMDEAEDIVDAFDRSFRENTDSMGAMRPVSGEDRRGGGFGGGTHNSFRGFLNNVLGKFDDPDEFDENTVEHKLQQHLREVLKASNLDIRKWIAPARNRRGSPGHAAGEFFEELLEADLSAETLEELFEEGLPELTDVRSNRPELDAVPEEKIRLDAETRQLPDPDELFQAAGGEEREYIRALLESRRRVREGLGGTAPMSAHAEGKSLVQKLLELDDPRAAMEPDRYDLDRTLQDAMPRMSVSKRSTLGEALQGIRPGGLDPLGDKHMGRPFTTETIRSSLLSQFVGEDSELVQKDIVEILKQMHWGNTPFPSVAQTDAFGDTFGDDLKRRLQRTDIPDEQIDSLVIRIRDQIAQSFRDRKDLVVLSDLLDLEPDELEGILDDAIEDFETMELEGDENDETINRMIANMKQLKRQTAASVEQTEELFETRAAPGTRTAAGDDPWDIDWDDEENELTDFLKTFQKLENTITRNREGRIWGGRRHEGPEMLPGLFEVMDTIGDTFEMFSGTRRLEVTERLEGFHNKIMGLIPGLETVSANLGPLNISLRNMLAVVYGLISLLGPLVTWILGLASALVTVTAAMGAFVAVGAVGFLEEVQNSVAGVNTKMEAMQKIAEQLKEDVMEAVEPLQNAQIGGDGRTGIQAFIDLIRGGLDILHHFSHAMAEIVEMDVFAEQLDRLTEALFTADEGPRMIEALKELTKRVLPLLTDFLVFIINHFPEWTMFMAEITDDMSEFGSVLAEALPLLALGVKFGANLLGTLSAVVKVMFQVLNAVIQLVNWIGPLDNDMMTLAGTLGTVIGVYWGAVAAAQTLSFIYSRVLIGVIWQAIAGFATLSPTLTAVTIATYEYASAVALATGEMILAEGVVGTLTTALYGLGSAVWAALGPVGVAIALIAALLYLLWELGNEGVFGKVVDWQFLWNDGLEDAAHWLGYLTGGPLVTLATLLYDIGNDGGLLPKVVNWTDLWNQSVQALNNSLEWLRNLINDVAGFFGMIGSAFQFGYQGPGPGGTANRSGTPNRTIVNEYKVQVQGGDRRDGKKIRREVEKIKRREQRYNGTNHY